MAARLFRFSLFARLRRIHLTALAAVLIIGYVMSSPARSQDQVELHLVLAFDASASVNDVEFDIQRTGTARALRHLSVQTAIEQADGGVAMSIIQWSSVKMQAVGLDWVILRTSEDVEAFADQVQAMPRKLSGGGTMVHTGLEFAARQLDEAPGTARRRVIDLSGNGRSDNLEKMLKTRDLLVRDGVVINALAIEELNDDLTSYFYRYLIGGTAAFVITADEFEDFSEAMQIKLHREIRGDLHAKGKDRSLGRVRQASR